LQHEKFGKTIRVNITFRYFKLAVNQSHILPFGTSTLKDVHVNSGLLPLFKRHNYKIKTKRAAKIKFLPYFVDNNEEEHLKRFLFMKHLMIPLVRNINKEYLSRHITSASN
jgi:hypothetical protein